MQIVNIRQRILAGFVLLLVILLVMGGIVYWQLQRVRHEAVSVQIDTLPGLYFSTRIESEWIENKSLTQEWITAVDQEKKQVLVSQIQSSWVSLNGSVRDYEDSIYQEKDRKSLSAFKALLASYSNLQQQIMHLGGSAQDEKVRALLYSEFSAINEKIEFSVNGLVHFNHTDVDASAQRIMAAVTAARLGILISFTVAIILLAIIGAHMWVMITQPLGKLVTAMSVIGKGDFSRRLDLQRRDEFGTLADGLNNMTDEVKSLIGQVQKSGIQVNTSITEIAATAKQQQVTASEIAATTTEISATSRQISATSKELVKTMTEVSTVAEQTATLAGDGQHGLSRMEETMHHVVEAASSINSKLAILNVKAGNINQVVITITKVADQTNLLSLNAAIEAEKAGEYGRGFSVVATEIRRLADQTAVATYDIEQMVREMQSAVSAGVMGMDKFSEEVRRGMHEIQQVGMQLSQIIKDVQTLVPRFELVNEGMQAQATGAEQISEALAQLGEAAQQTVESLRQSNMAVEELNQVSNSLRASISRFRLQAS